MLALHRDHEPLIPTFRRWPPYLPLLLLPAPHRHRDTNIIRRGRILAPGCALGCCLTACSHATSSLLLGRRHVELHRGTDKKQDRQMVSTTAARQPSAHWMVCGLAHAMRRGSRSRSTGSVIMMASGGDFGWQSWATSRPTWKWMMSPSCTTYVLPSCIHTHRPQIP